MNLYFNKQYQMCRNDVVLVAHLEVSVYNVGLLFVQVLHSAARLVENLQHRVAGDGGALLHPPHEIHQLA